MSHEGRTFDGQIVVVFHGLLFHFLFFRSPASDPSP
jgi:hypothetical protein